MRRIRWPALLRFRLRTLLCVVLLIAVWIGFQMKTIRERAARITEIKEHGGTVMEYSLPITGLANSPEWFQRQVSHISTVRTWLGDPPVAYISLGKCKMSWT